MANYAKTAQISISDISANSGKAGSIDVPSVTGMTPYCVVPIGTNHSDTVITECRLITNNTKISISIFNLYSSTQNATGTVVVLYK